MSKTSVLCTIAFAWFLPTAVAAQGTSGWPEVVRQFDAYVEADQVAGASLLYMGDGKVVAQHNVGYADRASKRLVDDGSIFHWYKNILVPLGLQPSYFRGTPKYLRAQRSHNYSVTKNDQGVESVVDNGSDFDPGITTPNSGWNAPLSDIARFVAFLTGKPANGDVLSRSSLEEMRQPGKSAGTDQWMGLSTFIIKHGETTILGHTGSQAGFRAFLYFNPATSTAVICAFNTTSETSGEKVVELRDRVFDFLAKSSTRRRGLGRRPSACILECQPV